MTFHAGAPKFTQMLESKKVGEGASASFSVAIAGEPTPDVMWMKDGRPLSKSLKVSMLQEDGVHTLMLTNNSLSDAGVYGVTASNVHGEIQCDARLDVYGK